MATAGRRFTGVIANERGAALFAAVAAMLLLSTMMVAFIVLGRSEVQIAQLGKDEAQAMFGAEGGGNHGRWMLAQRLRTDFPREVTALGRPAMKTRLQTMYNTPAGAAQMLVDLAIPQGGGGPAFQLCTAVSGGCPEPNFSAVGNIPDAQQAVLTLTSTNPPYTTRVIVGSHPAQPPVITNGGLGADFTFVWRIESSGTSGRAQQQFVIHDSAVPDNPFGAFKIALNASFVQYAHFIDNMDATQAWISFRHIYTGPVHTNNRFNILGNISVPGQEGPTFRSDATSWDNSVRFNNGGSPAIQARDSSANDWPLLGPSPGILCKQVDCSGFTRNYDYDPTTPTIDKIPFPTTGTTDRTDEITKALGPTFCPSYPTCIAGLPSSAQTPVLVANTLGITGNGTMNGGVYVQTRVVDLQLEAAANGQKIIIETPTVGGIRRQTVITEDRAASTTRVQRNCLTTTGAPTVCSAAGTVWNPDTTITTVAARDQTLTGLFSPDLSTDRGVLFVANSNVCPATPPTPPTSAGCPSKGAIGEPGSASSNGLRKNPSSTVTRAIDKDTRLTIAADGDIFITGHLNYKVEPRGPDLVFSSPIPGDPPGVSDDQMDVQNALGVVSWDGGIHLSSYLSQTNLNNTLPAGDSHRDGDLRLHGMFMAPNINGGGNTGEGQISFDDYTGTYRGYARILGGVVQKTMGTFGQPSSNTGYARDWVYDERFRYRGLSPPSFPGFPNFTTGVGLGIDSYTWRLGLFN